MLAEFAAVLFCPSKAKTPVGPLPHKFGAGGAYAFGDQGAFEKSPLGTPKPFKKLLT
jgi:hypothetical protein